MRFVALGWQPVFYEPSVQAGGWARAALSLALWSQAWEAGPLFPPAQMDVGWGGVPKDSLGHSQSFWPTFRQSPQILLVAMAEDRQLPGTG